MIPKNSAHDPSIMTMALDYIEKELNILKAEDWYRVSRVQLSNLGPYKLIVRGGGLFSVLQKFRPTVPWEESKFI